MQKITKSTYTPIVIWILIIAIASFLRFWQLDTLPEEIHRDEASIGFNAYSILITGHDEYGVEYPINFRAFGEYKLPGLIYLVVPFIKVFGLTPFAIRFPTAIAGVLGIPALYWLTRELGFSKKIAYIAVFFLTISYWHVTQSRNVYEPMVGLLWSTLAISAWLRGQKRGGWLVLAIIFYLVSSFFYNVPWLMLPAIFLVISLHSYSKIVHLKKIIIALLMVFLVFVAIGLALMGVNSSRSGITVFKNPELATKAADFLFAARVSGMQPAIAKIIESPMIFPLQKFFENYLSAFNPAYLFSYGDINPWHSLRQINLGNFNVALIIPMGFGILAIIKQWKRSSYKLLAMLIFITPLVSAITAVAPITNRLLDFHLTLVILAAVGIDYLFKHWQQFWAKPLFIIWTTFYLMFFTLFFFRYFFVFNHTYDFRWNNGQKEFVRAIIDIEDQYNTIYVSGWDIEYISFAFYKPFPPEQFANQAERYISGFDHVSKFQNYVFKEPPLLSKWNLDEIESIIDSGKDILIGVRQEKKLELAKLIRQQTTHTGEVLWSIYEIKNEDLADYFAESASEE